MIELYTIHDPRYTPETWDFVEIDDVLYPVIWDPDAEKYHPYDLEEDAEEWEVYEQAELAFGMPVEDGGVDGADIDSIEP